MLQSQIKLISNLKSIIFKQNYIFMSLYLGLKHTKKRVICICDAVLLSSNLSFTLEYNTTAAAIINVTAAVK